MSHGRTDGKFTPMQAAFDVVMDSGRETGAALAVYHDGECVVDLWAGHADRKRTRGWEQDTLCCAFSVTKAMTATCVLQAVAEGKVALDLPVADLWPEFAANGKAEITTRQLLTHQAGVVGFHAPVAKDLLYNWQATVTLLAKEAPWWTPGEAHGYHARTFGFLLGEVLRRATGMTVGEWFAEKIAQPDDLDFHIGLTAAQVVRCADMLPARIRAGETNTLPESARALMRDFSNLATPTGAAFQNPSLGAGYMNSERFRTAELPAQNGHGTARAIARVYDLLPELIPEHLMKDATTTHSRGMDKVLHANTHFGLGFMLHDADSPMGGRNGCFGHAGAGGSLAFCDPHEKISFCFVMNQMEQGVISGGQSAMALVQALRACV